MPGSLYVGVDSGGSSTRIAMGNEEVPATIRRSRGSLNVASGGVDLAVSQFRELVAEPVLEASRLGFSSVSAVIGSAGYGGANYATFLRAVADLMTEFGLRFKIRILNDADALVLGDSRLGSGAIVLGTGSCALALGSDAMVRVGGVEYVASDQGGATFLGQHGLIMAVKAGDGRGDPTLLTDRVAKHFGMSVTASARAVAEAAHPKPLLAGLAPVVLDCAYSEGDAVARRVVDKALAEVGDMMRAVVSRCPPAKFVHWKGTGGLLANSTGYRADVEKAAQSIGIGLEYVEDASLDCYRMARKGTPFPPFVDCAVLEG